MVTAEKIAVYAINVLDAEAAHFWIHPLEEILYRFPFMEFPHRQQFYTVISIEEGYGTIRIDDQEYEIQGSEIFCIHPNSVYSIQINKFAKGRMICFTPEFFSLRYNENALHKFKSLKNQAAPSIRISDQNTVRWQQILWLMEREYLNKSSDAVSVLRSYLHILLCELERMNTLPFNPYPQSTKQEKMQELEALLESRLQELKKPSDFAKALHVTPNYLNRICKDETGVTLGEVIRNRIVQEAQRLLYHTGMTVNEVAYKLGFDNASYFITLFKKKTEKTPEQYRRLKF